MKMNWVRVALIALILILMAFLIPSGAVTAEGTSYPPLPMDDNGGPAPNEANYLSDSSYADPTIAVSIRAGHAYDTDYLVAHITISNPTQLRTASASGFSRKGGYVGTYIAKRVKSVLAVNGDYFTYRTGGYIVRQGKRYRNMPQGQDLLLIDSNGNLHGLHSARVEDVDAFYAALPAGVEIWNTLSFGPILVENGVPAITGELDSNEPRFYNMGAMAKAQRVCIGQLGPLEYFIVSTEGPEDAQGSGMTATQFAEVVSLAGYELSANGAIIAYNLDGGSSNTLVFYKKKINSPDNPKSRDINDIVYFATLVPEE
jgi:exopolysaccharide biosynthesis protein